MNVSFPRHAMAKSQMKSLCYVLHTLYCLTIGRRRMFSNRVVNDEGSWELLYLYHTVKFEKHLQLNRLYKYYQTFAITNIV